MRRLKEQPSGPSRLRTLPTFRSRAAGRSRRRAGQPARRPSRAQALVEFALILPVLALLLVAILDLGRMFYSYEALANAAREGARYYALHPGEVAATEERVRAELDGRVSPVTITVACPESGSCANLNPGQEVRVTVSWAFTPITPLISAISGGPINVQTSASMVAWQ